ncbi:MAG TPA: hypothetical protein VKB58_16480 [Terriglobales bacterium]|nr:hypothetical protein [Terriglobales bacterium]
MADRSLQRVELYHLAQRLEISREYPVGAVQVRFGLTDLEETMGGIEFDQRNRVIRVRLNVAHHGIRAAATALDEQTLDCYVAELCFIGTGNVRRATGDWPWTHEGWPEFLADCDDLGRHIRRPGSGRAAKIQSA